MIPSILCTMLFAVATAGAATPQVGAPAVRIASGGKALMAIAIDTEVASAEETRAANNLASYLQQMTGAAFSVVDEGEVDATTPAIYVGNTAFADSQGIHTRFLAPQETRVRTCAGSLILCGGRPVGTVFGVWRFLEEELGCRWYTVYDEVVPEQPELSLGNLDHIWVPAFRFREMYRQGGHQKGPYGTAKDWEERNRIHHADIGRLKGANTVHTFIDFFDPNDYVDEHPEWSSYYGGAYHRRPRDQFCMAKEGPRRIVLERMRELIRKNPDADYYELSENDGNQERCQCPECLALEEREGKVGPMLDFVNFVANGIGEEFPEARIRTLAYNRTGAPPKTLRVAPNVCIRKCLNHMSGHLTTDDPRNKATMATFAGWAQCASSLGVWEYDDRPYKLTGLPIPAFLGYQSRYRAYPRYEVESVFSESEMMVKPRQLVGMKHWVALKLMEDPSRDVWDLVSDYAHGVYGAAGPQVVAYVKLLEDRRRDWPWALFDVPFFVKSQGLMDAAMKATANDSAAQARLRQMRFTLNLAHLLFWSKAQTDWARRGGDPAVWTFDKATIIGQVRPYLASFVAENRWFTNHNEKWGGPDLWRGPWQELYVEPICAEAEQARDIIPLPPELADIPPEDIVEIPVPVLRYGGGIGPNLQPNYRDWLPYLPQPDPQAASGLAVFISQEWMKSRGVLPLGIGLFDHGYGFIKREDITKPGYQLYRMVARGRITEPSYVFFYGAGPYQLFWLYAFAGSDPNQLWDIYLSARWDGPDMPFGDPEKPNGVWIDRLMFVKAPTEDP